MNTSSTGQKKHLVKRGPAPGTSAPAPKSRKRLPEDDTKITFLMRNGHEKVKLQYLKETLIRNSPVFEAMLNGNFPLPENGVTISDISAEGFELLMQCIQNIETAKDNQRKYPSKLVFDSLEQAIATLFAANKYMIMTVEDYLGKCISRYVDCLNVLPLLAVADFLKNQPLRGKCWAIIERFAYKVVMSRSFLSISWDHLCQILENPHLIINELLLLRRVVQWCEKDKYKNKGKRNMSIQEILGVAVYKLRIPIMTPGEFVKVKGMNILAKGELNGLEKCFRRNSVFPNTKRAGICHCASHGLNCQLCVGSGRTSSVRSTRVIRIRSKQPVENCDCRKYLSCPNYPNGETVSVLNAIDN